MSETWTIENRVANEEDWLNGGTPFEIDVCATSYVKPNSKLLVENRDGTLWASVEQTGPTLEGPGVLLPDNGQLYFSTTTPVAITGATGTEYPAGTQLQVVFSMIFAEKIDGTDEQKHITGLTLLDNPEDAGVMGGVSGGGP